MGTLFCECRDSCSTSAATSLQNCSSSNMTQIFLGGGIEVQLDCGRYWNREREATNRMNTTMGQGTQGMQGVQPEKEAGLNQFERVVDTYVAPTKTFIDIRRDASWWMPFILAILVSLFFVTSVDQKIGFDQVAQININRSASAQQRMSTLTPAEREHGIHLAGTITKAISYSFPAIGLIFALLCAAILMASFNFGLGAKASYGQYLAVWYYAGLPMLIKFVLAGIAIFAGASAEGFDMNNPVGTNIGWYMPSDSPLWVRTVLSSVDVFTIWTVVLLIIGCATVAKVKRSSAAFIVVGWWILVILGSAVGAAYQG
jgi:Yip1 domain